MKQTNIEKAIAQLEDDKKVIDLAIAKLRQQMPARKPRGAIGGTADERFKVTDTKSA